MERRSFLKNLGLAGAAFTVPAAVVKAGSTDRKQVLDLSNLTLKGRVHSNGKGITGVAVTDGLNVTNTDTNGIGNHDMDMDARADELSAVTFSFSKLSPIPLYGIGLNFFSNNRFCSNRLVY